MLHKPAETDRAIHPLLINRWSPRAYTGDLLTTDQLLDLFEAARWAPSGGNGQPWSFIIFPHDDAENFARAVGCLAEGNVIWAKHAPLLVLTVAQTLRDNGAPNRTALYDLGQAVAHLSVQAGALGLSLRQMGGFDVEKARAEFGIPAGHDPVTFIALGALGDHMLLPEPLRERETQPRIRKPLAQFVFRERWGAPAPLVADSAPVASE
jgi:nitroreductase